MSIYDEINDRIQEGRLVELWPDMRGSMTGRHMIVTPDIAALMDGPWESEEWEDRCGRLRADVNRFLTGARIPVTTERYGGEEAYLKQLEPHAEEVWEIRSIDPNPAIRLIGRFAGRNRFVGLGWAKRVDLGGFRSPEWRTAIEGCKAEWNRLFPAYPPLLGDYPNIGTIGYFDTYVSNCFLV